MDGTEGGNRYEEGARLFDEAAGHARDLWEVSKKALRPALRENYEKETISFRQDGEVQRVFRHLRQALLDVCAWGGSYSPDPLSECLASASRTGRPDATPTHLCLSPVPPWRVDDEERLRHKSGRGGLNLERFYHRPGEVGELLDMLLLAAEHCRKLACPTEHPARK